MTASTGVMTVLNHAGESTPPEQTVESIRDAARWALSVTGTEFSAPNQRMGSYLAGAIVTGALIFGVTGTASTLPVGAEGHARLIAFAQGGTGIITEEFRPITIVPPSPAQFALDAAIVNTVAEADQIRWLHEASGLTWDQLGRVFGVSRRAVHLWANGGRLNAANASKLAHLGGLVREMKARNPDDLRAQLLAAGPDGRSIADKLRERDHDGDISGTPWNPAQLLGARHDRPSSPT